MLDGVRSIVSQSYCALCDSGTIVNTSRKAYMILICSIATSLFAASIGCLGGYYDDDLHPTFSTDGQRAAFIQFRHYTRLPMADSEVIRTDVNLHHWSITNPDIWRTVELSTDGPPVYKAKVIFSPDSRYVAIVASDSVYCVDLESNLRRQLSLKQDHSENLVWAGPREVVYVTKSEEPEGGYPAYGLPRMFWRIAIDDPPTNRVLIHKDENCIDEDHYSLSPQGGYLIIPPTMRSRWRCVNLHDSSVFEFGATNRYTYYTTGRPFESSISWTSDESRAVCMNVYVKEVEAFILHPRAGKANSFDKEAMMLFGGASAFLARLTGLEAEWSPDNKYLVLSQMGRLLQPGSWKVSDVRDELNLRFPSQKPFQPSIRKLSVPGWLLVIAEDGRNYITDFERQELHDLGEFGLNPYLFEETKGDDDDESCWLISPDGSHVLSRSLKRFGWEVHRLKSPLPRILCK